MDAWVDLWEDLDPAAEPRLVWIRTVAEERFVLLLGAFDPPTVAHVDVLHAACERALLPGAFCLTKVLLDRPGPSLLDPARRLELLSGLGFGVACCNRGTYLEVSRAARGRAVFVVGSDKLSQLEDPSFYPDGDAGVRATFQECRFLVVPRGPAVTRGERLDVPGLRDVSASRVRDMVRRGESIRGLVPPSVADALQGYTDPTAT